MVMSPAGYGTKNGYAGEDQQQFTKIEYKVSYESGVSTRSSWLAVSTEAEESPLLKPLRSNGQ
jgi:hypothetical protein